MAGSHKYLAWTMTLLVRANVIHGTPEIISDLGLRPEIDQSFMDFTCFILTSVFKTEYKPKVPCGCECLSMQYINLTKPNPLLSFSRMN